MIDVCVGHDNQLDVLHGQAMPSENLCNLPGGISSASGVQVGKAKTLRRLLRCRRRFERLGTEHFQRARDGVAKLVIVETDPLPGIVESISERVDLPLERFLTIPIDFEFIVSDLLFFAVQLRRVDFPRELLGIGAAYAVAKGAGESVFEQLREAPEFLADGFRFPPSA
jgi:hypothetical protein